MPSKQAHPPKLNHLAGETSPYLLEHASNPVNWYPWGEPAFRKAKAEDKPIFLSIGYSSCHWCHVMREESFEDPEVARLMNDVFVNIKVDREERPDVDLVYMTACQMMTGGGGWPLTIMMTHDLKPFLAATYIPKASAFGRIGMLQLIPRVKEMWKTDRKGLLETAGQVVLSLMSSGTSVAGEPDEDSLKLAFGELNEHFDAESGGFGAAPKFPTPHNFMFLLRYWRKTGDARALSMVEKSLKSMRAGGIWDQLGGGFHRYSTDRRWAVPHFEKMLYDQAMMIIAYSEAYQATRDAAYAGVVEETISYLMGRMRAPSGGYCSSEDADSDGEEGKFYVWRKEEFDACLGSDSELFAKVFGVEGKKPEAGLSGEVLQMRRSPAEWASETGCSIAEFEAKLNSARARLLAAREARTRPSRDEKALSDWNGLLLVAFSKAARALGREDYAKEGRRLADFLLSRMRGPDGRIVHAWRGDRAVKGTIDDLAFVTWGLLEMYQASFDEDLLSEAIKLSQDMVARFWDASSGGFFFTPDDGEEILARQKPFYDSAIPSGNSVAAYVLFRLGRLASDLKAEKAALETVKAGWEMVVMAPSGHTMLLCALDYFYGPSHELVIAGRGSSPDVIAMSEAVNREFLPNTVVVFRGQEGGSIQELAPFLAAMTSPQGRATAYVCQNRACLLPTTEVAKMLEELKVSRASPERP